MGVNKSSPVKDWLGLRKYNFGKGNILGGKEILSKKRGCKWFLPIENGFYQFSEVKVSSITYHTKLAENIGGT